MMTVHKLTAGDGYTYLTRQVASADERRPRGQELADYYVARGNPPGVWLGAGAMALGLAGTEVTEAQMRALFGDGCHPDRDRMLAEGATVTDTKLGRSYPKYGPAMQADTSDHTARKPRRAVAGFDLVFTPVKSASLLWALGGPAVREQVEAAHHEAVQNTLGWIEEHAAFTRAGAGGRAQIDTSGLICAAFDHRESRTGDPDLHTHLAIANKVLGVDGTWRALDARGLHALGVAASERYNTRFEDALTRRLGVHFVDRPGRGPGKRPVREVDGVSLRLIRHFSRRRAAIEDRYAELASAYRHQHGRDPDRSTQLHLAQQATLETRDGKPPGRTLAEQVDDWTSQACRVLGGSGVSAMVRSATGRRVRTVALDDVDVDVVASQVLAVVSAQRSTWSRWNVVAETERALRPLRFDSAETREQATASVVEAATGPALSVRIAEPELVRDPAALRRSSDGESVFVPHGSERYTSSQILVAEERLVAAARTQAAVALDPLVAEAVLAVHESASGIALDHGQRQLVLSFLSEPRQLLLGIGPAGTGKTTAMRAFAAGWAAGGGRVVPLASSSRAAQVLSGELGLRAENVHKFLHEARRSSDRADPWFTLGRGDVILVDEAGMAGTLLLRELVDLAADAGAVVRLLGDPHQLAAPEAGGALRLLETEVGAARLDHLHRFDDPDEAAATLGLRAGDPTALAFYQSHKRIRSGSRGAMLEAAYDGWSADFRAGLTSVLVAAATEDVSALSARARVERVHLGQVEPTGVELHDGNRAGVGDWVVTRTNLRGLTCNRGRDWVKNGDLWSVIARHDDGGLTVRSFAHRGTVHLAGPYVADQVELGYATTTHRAQGTTVDTAHPLVSPEMTREALYVASTRARSRTTWYVAVEDLIEADADHEPPPAREAREVLCSVLARIGAQTSATEALRAVQDDACSLPTLVRRYQHARDVASRDALALAAQSALSPRLASRLLADPAVGVVARSLANAAGAGEDIVSVLCAVADARELRTADSPARVLAYRLDEYAGSIGFSQSDQLDRPLPWLPSPEVGHPGWRDYLAERARLINDRAEQLAASTADHRLPGWAASLGPRPHAADARRLWQTAVGLAAAYREQYVVGADLEPLGDPPNRGSGQERAYRLAASAIEDARLAQPASTTPGTSPSMPSRQRDGRTYKPSLHL